MTEDDVLFGYRLQLFDLAVHTTVSHACRTFGVHRSTYYRWKAQVDRQGLDAQAPGALPRADAQPDAADRRAADHRPAA
jgi:transposase-like protein